MKLVPESLNEMDFERGQDPKDILGLGLKKVREIKKAFNFISPYIETMKAEELDFREFRKKIDELKNTLDIIVVNHINEKYNLGAKLIENPPENSISSAIHEIAKAEKNGNSLVFYKNGPGNAFWFNFFEGNNSLKSYQSAQSYRLSTLDRKLDYILKNIKW